MAVAFRWRERTGRPAVRLDVFQSTSATWPTFAPHHYLTRDLNPSAACFVGEVDGTPVAFVAIRYQPMSSVPGWMFHRLVTLPEWQGLGVALRLVEFVAREYQQREPHRVRMPTRHPGLARSFERSPLWRCVRSMGPSTRRNQARKTPRTAIAERGTAAAARGEITATFEWVGP